MSGIVDIVNLGRPYADLWPGARGRVLAAVVQVAPIAVTVRELATRADASPQGTLDIVNDLARSGIVETSRSGGSILVLLNRDHLAVGPLEEIVRLRLRFVERLTAHLGTWPPVLDAAWLFGSAARGDGDRESDIDLLLVAVDRSDPRWDDLTDDLRSLIERWTGNATQFVEHDGESFSQLVRSDNPLIAALRKEGIPLTRAARARLRPSSMGTAGNT